MARTLLANNSEERKRTPITRGVLDYFPLAVAAVARVSFKGNEKHNPGEDLHWARCKSTDQADAIARHLMERGSVDEDSGELAEAHLAWRALALCQIAYENRADHEPRNQPAPAGPDVSCHGLRANHYRVWHNTSCRRYEFFGAGSGRYFGSWDAADSPNGKLSGDLGTIAWWENGEFYEEVPAPFLPAVPQDAD